ncbi:MAG: hypothetical protein HYY06_23920 [Deltaproteobacteria bacterium]|nr:hypothetical protein [Deltaproteobacteria bacterium]
MRGRARWCLACGVGLGLACSGAADDASIVILGNVAADASCSYSTSPDAEMVTLGYVDIAFGRRYVAHLLVENRGSDPVEVLGGWRNVWFEPSHTQVVGGRGDKARGNLVASPVVIEGGGRAIVEVDPLGDAFINFKREFEETVAGGGAPLDWDSSIVLVLEGDADSTAIESDEWLYGITVGLGRLVSTPEGTDSPFVAGVDCCLGVPSADRCETGQNGHVGSCSECASCWPEVCNFGHGPACGGEPLPDCVVE